MDALLAAVLMGAASTDDIVVTAALPSPALERAYSMSILTAEDIAARGAARLDDALRLEPGFQLFRRASSRVANPTTQGVTLRALGGNAASRVTLLLDGVPQEDPFAGWIPFSALSVGDVASVQIIRGGGAVAAGSGALAGALAIASMQPDDTGGFVEARYGRFNSFDVSGGVGVVDGAVTLQLAASVYDSDGYPLIALAQRGRADVAAASHARTVRARLGYALDAASSLQLAIVRFDEDKLAGFANAPNANSGTDASLRYVRDGGTGGWSVDGAAWIKKRDFSSVFAAANAARSAAAVTLDQYAVPGKGWGGRIEVRAPKMAALSVRFGADAKASNGETREFFRSVNGVLTRDRRAGGTARVIGGFAEAAVDATPELLLTAGARIDRWSLGNGMRLEKDRATGAVTLSRVLPARKGTEWTGRAGLVWQATPALTARLAGYIGWRLPTLNELYRPFRVGNDVTEANGALAPERLKGLDAGLAFAPLPQMRLEVTAFWNDLENAISNVTLGTGPGVFPDVGFLPAGGTFRQRANLPAVRSRGIELRAETPLGRGLSLSGGYSYADARVRDAGGFAGLQGKRLTQSPRHQGSIELRWADAADRFAATASMRGQSGVFEDDANSRALRGFVTVDLGVRARLAPGWQLTAKLENGLNSQIQSAISGDGVITLAQPRSLSVGVRAEF